jgi:hypothetical protein
MGLHKDTWGYMSICEDTVPRAVLVVFDCNFYEDLQREKRWDSFIIRNPGKEMHNFCLRD